jgi:asparagine synthase (glutamine-hydrolysing)
MSAAMRVMGGIFTRNTRSCVAREDLARMIAGSAVAARHVALAGSVGLFGSELPSHGPRGSDVHLLADVDVIDVGGLDRRVDHEAPHQAVIALYERSGAEFVRELQGAFAIAVWDPRARQLLLAVDRFGVGRLYYAVTRHGMAFASRVDALCKAPDVDPAIRPSAVFQYLNFGYVPSPDSIYRGIRRVPPGHVLLARDGTEPRLERYWDLRYTERPVSAEDAALQVFAHTEAAVARVLGGSPKETGAFLSGGTDSSTIVGLMSRLTGERVNAFSIGFNEPRYDELSYAELAARHFRAAHYTHVIEAREALELLPSLVEAYDEPFGNDSAIGTAICARLAASCGVNRLVAGDGGDEIFGGNERYRTDAVFQRYFRLPRPVRRWIVEPALSALPDGGSSVLGRGQRYVRRAKIPNPGRFYSYEFHLLQNADEFLAPEFVAAAGPSAPLDVLDRHWARSEATSELNRLLYLDMKLTIGDNDLYKVTRTAELAGVRVSFPMLDTTLVEFMATLPSRYKVRGLEKRYLFKRAFADLLPAATLAKRKHGFGVPAGRWLRDDPSFAGLAHDALLGPSARTAQYFRPGAVARLFRLHAEDVTTFYGSLLWTVLMLELWHRRHAGAGVTP